MFAGCNYDGPLAVAQPDAAPERLGQPGAGRRGGRPSRAAALPGHAPALRRRRAVRQDRRERARPGRLHHPADQSAGREHDRAAAPHGRGPAGQRGAGHGGHSVLRLRPAGPEGPAAGGHQRQAHGQHGVDGRRRSGAGDGFPPAPAAGVLRPAGRPPVRGAGVREPLPAEAAARPGRRGAGRRLGQDGARVRQAAQRVAGDHRQAAAVGQRGRGGERRRRGEATATASSPTT